MTNRLQSITALLLILAALAACGAAQPAPQAAQEPQATISLTSSAFSSGEAIPVQYTCQGQDLSPPVSWSEPPSGTRSLALVCDDPDAPGGTWVHWILFNLPAELRALSESAGSEPPSGSASGSNSWQQLGYGGPCPPAGPAHRYFFRLYALDTVLDLSAGASKADLEQAMAGHILAQGELMGRFGATSQILNFNGARPETARRSCSIAMLTSYFRK